MNDESKHSGTVVYDSNCVLCSATVKFLITIDRKKKLKFTTFNSKAWENLSTGFRELYGGINAGGTDSIVFYQDTGYYLQSDAIVKIIETLSYPWKFLKVIKFIPRNIREKLYRIIARNRFLIFGKRTNCALPSQKIRDRFLT